jgi:outer membrane protein assembly factor BamB
MEKISAQLKKAVLAMVFIILFQQSYAQWPQWRGATRNGISKETSLLREWPPYGPKLVWSSDTVGEGFTSATIEDNMVYCTGKRDSVEIISAFDFGGKLIWQTVLGKASKEEWPESRCTPTVCQGKIYTMTVLGNIFCLDSKTGKVEWTLNSFEKYQGVSSYNGFGENMLVDGDRLIFTPCGKKTTVVALNRLNGQMIWESESIKDTNYFTSPLIFEDKGTKTIVGSTLNYFIAVDYNTGKILNKQRLLVGIIPIIDQNQVYFSNFRGGLKMDLKDYSIVWRDSTLANYYLGVVKLGERLFGTNQRNNTGLVCVEWVTGKVLSTNKEINPASIITANGMLYCYEERNGRVCLVRVNEDNTTELVSSFKVKAGQGPSISHLSIANGFLFVHHGKYLLAYDIRENR